MQLTRKHREYWSKNLAITGDPALHLVRRHLRRRLLRPRARRFNFFGWPFAFYMAAQGSLIIYVVIIWYYARYMNNLDQRVRRRRRGGRHDGRAGTRAGGVFSAGPSRAFNVAAEEDLHLVHGRLHRLRHRAGDPRADGAAAQLDRLHLPARHGRPLRRHRRHEPDVRRGRVLRRGPARAGAVQRHGDRRRLDERGVVHRHGRHAVPAPASTASRSSWAGPAATAWWRCSWRRTCASSASSRFPTSSARATAATSRASIGIFAAILCSFTYVVAQIYGVGLITTRLTGVAVRDRHLPRPGRHPGLLVPGRHARGHLDAGRAVHHPDRRLHDPGGLAVGEAHRRPGAAARLRQGAGEGHGARGGAAQGPEGARGPRHLQGARRRGGREAEGPAGSRSTPARQQLAARRSRS